jgi:peptide deformylase
MNLDPQQLAIVCYPHPTLRFRSQPLKRVDPMISEVARRMLDLMYAHRGVGLAANQVDLPFRMFVANPSGDPEQGPERVFINPVIERPKGSEAGEEGCLSLPGVQARVKRSKSLRLLAYDLTGNPIDEQLEGYMARIVQHELDHLNGVLFIDRLNPGSLPSLAEDLEALQLDYQASIRSGKLPPEDQIQNRRQAWLERYC